MPLHFLEPGSVGAWHAVPQTQRRGSEYLTYSHRIAVEISLLRLKPAGMRTIVEMGRLVRNGYFSPIVVIFLRNG